MDDISIFFFPPNTKPTLPNRFGVLYLLRRDIDTCMGNDPTTRQKLQSSAIWPGVMAIMAGIDLLAKFYAGCDDKGKVGSRFIAFLQKFFDSISPDDQETLYQLRNSLLHSFGLYAVGKQGKVYRFSLSQNGNLITPPTDPDDSGRYVINVRRLQGKFESAVSAYQNALITGSETQQLQKNFYAIFPNYGAIDIG